MTETPNTITIDGKAYDAAALSQIAKEQITNVRATDAEIARLQTQLAIAQTARTAYARALQDELNKTGVAPTVQ